MKNFCPNCGHAIKSNATFCPNCGYNLLNKESKVNQVNSGSVKKVEKSKFCPICGKKIKGDAKICPNCGHSFVEKKVDTGKTYTVTCIRDKSSGVINSIYVKQNGATKE